MGEATEITEYREPRGIRIRRYAVIALNLAIVVVVSAVFLLNELQDFEQSRLIAEFHLPAAHLAESATHELAHLEIYIRGDAAPREGSEADHMAIHRRDSVGRTLQDRLYQLSEYRRSLAGLHDEFRLPQFRKLNGLVDLAFAALFESSRNPAAGSSDEAFLDAIALLEFRLDQLERLNLSAAERILDEDSPFFVIGERTLLFLFVLLVVSVTLVTAGIVRRLEVASAERTQAVAQMQQTSSRLAQMADRLERAQKIAKIGSWEWDSATGKEWWSDEVYRVIGMDPQTAPPPRDVYLDLIHPADRSAVMRVASESENERTGYRVNFRVVLQDGNERVLREIGEPIIDDDGELTGQRGTVQDVTEQYLAERRLKETAQRLEAALRLARLGTWEWDLDRNILVWSEETTRIFGLGADGMEIPNDDVMSMVHPDDRNRFFELSRKTLESGDPYTLEYRIIRKDGSVRTVIEHAARFTDGVTGKTRVYGTIRDITESKRVQEELAFLNAELEARVEARTAELRETQAELVRSERLATLGQLTATVSHELRNPLGAMRASMYVLEKAMEGCTDGAARAIERVNRNITRCDQIIDELLDFTRIRELRLQPTAIDSWLGQVLDEQVVPGCIEIGQKFGAPGLQVPADTDRLRRAVINVYENACHALTTPSQGAGPDRGKHLSVETRIRDDRLEIVFSDNGPGIPEDLRDKVFEPLFSTKNFGVGLGLPTVDQIMQQHGGGVTVGARPGGGTTFALWLPLSAEAETARP